MGEIVQACQGKNWKTKYYRGKKELLSKRILCLRFTLLIWGQAFVCTSRMVKLADRVTDPWQWSIKWTWFQLFVLISASFWTTDMTVEYKSPRISLLHPQQEKWYSAKFLGISSIRVNKNVDVHACFYLSFVSLCTF